MVPGASERIRVLHVDDESDFAALVAEMLPTEDDRFDVETASSASDGLDRLEAESFDCVVSDYAMPNMDGISFLERVRETHPDLPFVLFTGRGSEEVASEAITAGATDYLQKEPGPEQFELLANRIRNAVDQFRARRRATALDRIRTLASDVNQALVRASSKSEAEAEVCERLAETDTYQVAWIGNVSPDRGRLEPRASGGDGAVRKDVIEAGTNGLEPVETAVRERRVAVSQNGLEAGVLAPLESSAGEPELEAAAAVPLSHDEDHYGVLVVYAGSTRPFDAQERALLAELGTDVAHAIHSFEMEAQLRAERDSREALFAKAPTPVVFATPDPETGKHVIQEVNDAFESVFGFDREDVVGEASTEVHVPDEKRDEHARYRARSERGETITAEVERLTDDGLRDFVTHVIPFGHDGDLADGLYAWYTDITERKERERELEEKTERLEVTTARHELALQTTDAYTFDWDLETGDIERHPFSEEVLGLPADELEPVFDSYIDVIHPDYRDRVKAEMQRAIDEGAHYDVTYPLETPDDEQVWIRDRGKVLPSDGEAHRILGTVADVTEQKEREAELERQNERLNELVSVVSHDLRNPLNVAQGRMELVADACDSEHVDAVTRAHERMEALIEDFLKIAREGHRAVEHEHVALETVIDDSFQHLATGEATLVSETSQTIEADPSRLKQILENLFRNAVEHTDGAVTITVGALEDGFYVADDGPGIPPEEREQVFEPGYSTTRDGFGLGLNIVQQIATAHEWSVGVTDSADGGARFEFTGVSVVEA